MAAALIANPSYKFNNSVIMPMKSAVIKSGLFHAALIAVFAVGLPFVETEPTNISAPISVDIVNVSELSTTDKVAPPKKPKEEEPKPPEPAKKQEAAPKMTAETPPDLSKPKPPEVETAEDLPEPEPPPPLERTELKKPKPPKPKPEVTKTAKPKPQEDQMASLLRNLTPDAAEKSEAQDEPLDPDPSAESGQIARLADQLSMSEMDALRRQLGGCWNVMAGAKNAEELIVEVRVVMNRDRSVNRASILDTGRYNRDSHFRAAADAALRALRNPKCSPLQLPPDKYDQWKTVLIRFDPSDVL